MKIIARALFRLVLRCFPRKFAETHGGEMADAFGTEVERRSRTEGPFHTAWYVVRAVCDGARQGLRERLRHHSPRRRCGGVAARRGHRGLVSGIGMDMRLAWRSVIEAPGFSAAAVLVLALGIGANTTLFSALKMAVLKGPPFPDAERLVVPDLLRIRDGEEIGIAPWWPYPAFEMLRETPGRLIDPVAAYRSNRATLTGRGPATLIDVEIVSPEYFPLLGVAMTVGRAFNAAEADVEQPSRVVVLSHGFWRRGFGGSASALGQELVLNGMSYEIVGVAPPWFKGLKGRAELWLPMGAVGDLMVASSLRNAHNHVWYVVGRLRPGAQLEAARAQMQTIGGAIDAAFPFDVPGVHYVGEVKSFREAWTNDGARKSVLMLSGASILVLLAACANLSGLLLARQVRKARENAVRLAVGASRWRLVRSSLTESLLISCLAGLAGVALAQWGTRVLRSSWPERFLDNVKEELRVINLDGLTVDGTVLGCALATTLAAAVLVGVIPALRATKLDPSHNLKEGLSAARRGTRPFGFDIGQGMIAGQAAITVILLIGVGLVGESVRRLLDVELGFRADRLLTFNYRLPRDYVRGIEGEVRADDFHEELLRRVRALPGVQGVTRGCVPLRGVCNAYAVFGTERVPEIPRGEWPRIAVSPVDDSYFDVLEIPILAGRSLNRSDEQDDRTTVVLSETAANLFFPGEVPIGRWIQFSSNRAEVVGVAGTVLREPPDDEQLPEAFLSHRDRPAGGAGVMVRVAGDPSALVPSIRNELQTLEPEVPLVDVATMDDLLNRATGDRRLILGLLSTFAIVTVLLVAVGTWAVVAQAVADRNRELGVRIALGARSGNVLPLVLRRSLSAALLGLGVGLAAAWAGTRVLQVFLYRVSARDPWSFFGGALLLLGVVILASYIPARRATSIDPLAVLRVE